LPRRVGHREGNCRSCRHPERTRIDYLIATGAPLKPLAPRFGLNPSSLYNHAKKHISAEYRAAVRLGPFESGVSARWLVAFESGADDTFVSLTGQIRKNLELLAKLTKELLPPSPTALYTTNNFLLFEHPEYVQVIAALGAALRPFPEARQAVTLALRQFNAADERPPLEALPAPSEAA